MNKRNSIMVIILVVLAAIALYAIVSAKHTTNTDITTFDECKAAGYPIMESYPEQCRTPDGRTFVNPSQHVEGNGPTSTPVVPPTVQGNKDIIHVDSVIPNQLVGSPLVIKGSARGTWFFEASFPVELIDGNGKRLVVSPAHTTEDWMTEDFVPFSVTLAFTNPTTATGTLILHKDNPSGDPSRDQSLQIPVRFTKSERKVVLYFYNIALDKDASGNILCSEKGLVAVTRTIPNSMTPLKDTLSLLLTEKATQREQQEGLGTQFPLTNLILSGVSLSSTGTATLTIADPLHRTSGGVCRVSIIKEQIVATAKQFTEVKDVVFSPTTLFQP